ncbi:MAG: hypothetical protein JO147_02555 [Actinobacteria bacterium]|nr:hypothetical protein [Actinomycetota bacterium]
MPGLPAQIVTTAPAPGLAAAGSHRIAGAEARPVTASAGPLKSASPEDVASIWAPGRSSTHTTPTTGASISPYASVWKGPSTPPAIPSAAAAFTSTGWLPQPGPGGAGWGAGGEWLPRSPGAGGSTARRTAAIMAAAIVVIGGGAFGAIKYLGGQTSAHHTVAVPGHASGFVARTDDASRAAVAQLESMLKTAGANSGNSFETELTSQAQVGIYSAPGAPAGQPSVVLMAFDLNKAPLIRAGVATNGADDVVADGMAGTGAQNVHPVDSGSLGGAMSCGSMGGDGTSVCAWVDDSSVGLVMLAPSIPAASVATVAQNFRTATEH